MKVAKKIKYRTFADFKSPNFISELNMSDSLTDLTLSKNNHKITLLQQQQKMKNEARLYIEYIFH